MPTIALETPLSSAKRGMRVNGMVKSMKLIAVTLKMASATQQPLSLGFS